MPAKPSYVWLLTKLSKQEQSTDTSKDSGLVMVTNRRYQTYYLPCFVVDTDNNKDLKTLFLHGATQMGPRQSMEILVEINCVVSLILT